MPLLYALPYDTSADGFYFRSGDEYRARAPVYPQQPGPACRGVRDPVHRRRGPWLPCERGTTVPVKVAAQSFCFLRKTASFVLLVDHHS